MKKTFLALLIAIQTIGNAQIQQLSVGDRIPDLVLEDMIGWPNKTLKTSELRGKYLLLDFWALNCVPCVKSMPKMSRIQEKYRDRLHVVLVSFLSAKEKVLDFFDKREKAGYAVGLPTAVYPGMNNTLSRLFPSSGFPHIIWINPDGIIDAITGTYPVTESNVQKWIASKVVSVPQKTTQISFRHDAPLLVNGNGGPDTAFEYRSLVTGYIDSIRSFTLEKQRNARFTRLYIANSTFIEMLKEATGFGTDVYNKKLFINKDDTGLSTVVRREADPEWKKANLYCYDLILPNSFTIDEAIEIMLEDVCRYFKMTFAVVRKPVKCWVMKYDGKTVLPKGEGKPQIRSDENSCVSLINQPLRVLTSVLSTKTTPLIVDETRLSQRFNIIVDKNEFTSIDDLNKGLSRYGLYIEVANRELEVLVIKSKKEDGM